MSRRRGARAELEALFRKAVEAVDPGLLLRRAVTLENGTLCIAGEALAGSARLRVLAAGKAAGPMARALEEMAADRIDGGLVVTPEAEGPPLRRLELVQASHPVPDARSEAAARRALGLAARTAPDDVLLVLLSGGASSLLSAPAPGLGIADLAGVTSTLLRAGCDIEELNAVRKHLGAVAGGRLAEAAGARRIHVLALSDVPGDRWDVIGSGPCAADPSRYADALAVLERHGVASRVPAAARAHLEAGARGERPETPKPGDPRLARVRATLLAGNAEARRAACAAARERGLEAFCLGEVLCGEARVAGRRLAALGHSLRPARPVCAVAGGETVVHVRGPGRGGRSQELALAAALALEGDSRVALLAAGSDGRDGPTDAAGAHVDGGTVARGRERGLDAGRALAENDAYGFFAAEGGLLRTGPTGTNVMDLVLVRVAPA